MTIGSRIFGKTLAHLKSRDGLLNDNKTFIYHLNKELKPFDILLEKTPFRLTDRFIPGFWGHSALYLGNENQLREIGLWDHPALEKYQSKIKNGYLILEALRSGVRLSTIKSFSNIDDFALLRFKEPLSIIKQEKYLENALAQISKKYDYGFSFDENNRILCTEIIYLTFEDLSFKTSKGIQGRYSTIDQIAEKALGYGEFDLKMLYLGGELVEDTEKYQKFEYLLNNY